MSAHVTEESRAVERGERHRPSHADSQLVSGKSHRIESAYLWMLIPAVVLFTGLIMVPLCKGSSTRSRTIMVTGTGIS